MKDKKSNLEIVKIMKPFLDDDRKKEIDKVVQCMNNGAFDELFDKALEEQLSKPISAKEIYSEIANNYFILMGIHGIDDFKLFKFSDYEDYRKIIVDGKEYDFDNPFCHDDNEATETLCAIDCLMADLGEEKKKVVLKKLEKMINTKSEKTK